MPEIIEVILTLIIGFLAVYIACQQHRTAKDKLRLDLYEKRFSVYNGFKQTIDEIEEKSGISHGGFVNFFSKTNESDFLFDSDIIDYKNIFKKNLIRLQQLSGKLSNSQLPVGEKRINLSNENEQLSNWFLDQPEEIKNRFNKYLKFKKIIQF